MELPEGVIKVSELFQEKLNKFNEKNRDIVNLAAELCLTEANAMRLKNKILILQDKYEMITAELNEEMLKEYGEFQLTDIPGYIKILPKQ